MNKGARGKQRLAGLALLLLAACGTTSSDDTASAMADNGGTSAGAGSLDTGTPMGRGGTTVATSDGTTRRDRVVILGTSLTAGLGLDPDSAWPALIQRAADSAGFQVEFVNAGLSGETSAGALRRVDWVLAEPADRLILEVGANDGLRGVDPDSTAANITALIQRVKAAHPATDIALVRMEAPPNLGASYTARFRAVYPNVAEATGVRLLPFLLEGVAGEEALNQSDGIHPNESGSRQVRATMWAPIEAWLRGQ